MIDPREITNGAWRDVDGWFAMLPHRRFRADGQSQMDPERLRQLVAHHRRLLALMSTGSPLLALQAIRMARRTLDEIGHEAIALARGYRWSWRDIAEVLGLATSSVHKRFARKEVGPKAALSR